MAQRNYLINTTDLSLTASGTTIGSGNTQSATFVVARTLVRTGLGAGELLSGSQTWTLHYVVSAMATPYEMRLKVQRRNSGGTMQAESGYTTVRSATGTYDDPLTADLGTWSAGDQLAVVWEHRRPSGSGNKSGTIDANGASYVDAPADSGVTVNITGVSTALSPGALSVSRDQPLSGNEATASAGNVGQDRVVALTGLPVTTSPGSLTADVQALIVYATFTGTDGTDLTAYTPEIGGAFIKHASFSDAITIQSNRAGKDSNTGTTVYYSPATPNAVEYSVEGVIVDVGSNDRACGVGGWISTSADHGVFARRQNTTTWQFLKIISGAPTQIDTAPATFSAGASHKLRIKRTAGNQFEWFVDDVSQGVFTISDSEFASAGKIGIRASNSHLAAGYHIDTLSAFAPPSDVTVALTGIAATAQPGNLAADHARALTGAQATAQQGSIGVDRATPLTGSQATASAGSVSLGVTVGVSGVSGTLTAGNLAPALTKALTGIASAGEPGTLNVTTFVPLSGNASIVSPGTVGVPSNPDVTVALTGVSASAAAGNLSTDRETAITGAQSGAAAGNVAVNNERGLTSAPIVVEAGSVAPSTARALSGNESATGIGSLGVSRDRALTGDVIEIEGGDLKPGTATGLTGNATISGIGNLAPETSRALDGVTTNCEPGVLAVSLTVGLSGVAASAHAGSVFIPSGGERTSDSRRTATTNTGSRSVGLSSGRTTATINHGR